MRTEDLEAGLAYFERLFDETLKDMISQEPFVDPVIILNHPSNLEKIAPTVWDRDSLLAWFNQGARTYAEILPIYNQAALCVTDMINNWNLPEEERQDPYALSENLRTILQGLHYKAFQDRFYGYSLRELVSIVTRYTNDALPPIMRPPRCPLRRVELPENLDLQSIRIFVGPFLAVSSSVIASHPEKFSSELIQRFKAFAKRVNCSDSELRRNDALFSALYAHANGRALISVESFLVGMFAEWQLQLFSGGCLENKTKRFNLFSDLDHNLKEVKEMHDIGQQNTEVLAVQEVPEDHVPVEEIIPAPIPEVRREDNAGGGRHARITNLGVHGPYEALLGLPRGVPVVQPYHPLGYNPDEVNEFQQAHAHARRDEGRVTVHAAVQLEVENDRLPPGVRERLEEAGIEPAHVDVFVSVQDMPWNTDPEDPNHTALLLRVHPYVHPEAAGDGAYDLHQPVQVSMADVGRQFSPLADFNVLTHDGQYSPNNMRIQGGVSHEQSHSFYSLTVNPATQRAALTLHVLLGDVAHEVVSEHVRTNPNIDNMHDVLNFLGMVTEGFMLPDEPALPIDELRYLMGIEARPAEVHAELQASEHGLAAGVEVELEVEVEATVVPRVIFQETTVPTIGAEHEQSIQERIDRVAVTLRYQAAVDHYSEEQTERALAQMAQNIRREEAELLRQRLSVNRLERSFRMMDSAFGGLRVGRPSRIGNEPDSLSALQDLEARVQARRDEEIRNFHITQGRIEAEAQLEQARGARLRIGRPALVNGLRTLITENIRNQEIIRVRDEYRSQQSGRVYHFT